MKKEELIIQIKQILFDDYFPVSERNKWESLIPKMSEEDLQVLLENLRLKTRALFNVDQTLYKLAKTCEANLNIDEEIEKEAEKHPLQDLSKENLILLLEQKLSSWLEKDIDLKEEIEIYLSFEADPELRNKFLEALIRNEERLGKNNIIRSTGSELSPTVSNWLKDYEERIKEKPDRILTRTEYLTNSLNIQKISPKEKEKIKKIIELYDFLKFPISLTPIPGAVLSFLKTSTEIPPTSLSESSPESFVKNEPLDLSLKSQKETKQPIVKHSQSVSTPPVPAEQKAANLEEKYLEEEGEKK